MKTRTLIIASIAALALTSGAYAATGKQNRPHHGNGPKGATWSVSRDGAGTITVRVGSRVIYVYHPAPVQPFVSSSSAGNNDDCITYQLNCTDEQNCQHWGLNCQLIEGTPSDAQAAAQDGSTSDAAPVQADSSSADSTADAPATTDTAATAQSTNLADQTQNTDEDC